MFLNGKLSRSCTLEEVPKIAKGDIYINQDGGFQVNYLIYYMLIKQYQSLKFTTYIFQVLTDLQYMIN